MSTEGVHRPMGVEDMRVCQLASVVPPIAAYYPFKTVPHVDYAVVHRPSRTSRVRVCSLHISAWSADALISLPGVGRAEYWVIQNVILSRPLDIYTDLYG